MIVKTRVFEFYNNGYRNLPELAQAMGISVSRIYRVREGKCRINQKFVVGAVKAFPNYSLDDLFYFALESPTDTKPRIGRKKGKVMVNTAEITSTEIECKEMG